LAGIYSTAEEEVNSFKQQQQQQQQQQQRAQSNTPKCTTQGRV